MPDVWFAVIFFSILGPFLVRTAVIFLGDLISAIVDQRRLMRSTAKRSVATIYSVVQRSQWVSGGRSGSGHQEYTLLATYAFDAQRAGGTPCRVAVKDVVFGLRHAMPKQLVLQAIPRDQRSFVSLRARPLWPVIYDPTDPRRHKFEQDSDQLEQDSGDGRDVLATGCCGCGHCSVPLLVLLLLFGLWFGGWIPLGARSSILQQLTGTTAECLYDSYSNTSAYVDRDMLKYCWRAVDPKHLQRYDWLVVPSLLILCTPLFLYATHVGFRGVGIHAAPPHGRRGQQSSLSVEPYFPQAAQIALGGSMSAASGSAPVHPVSRPAVPAAANCESAPNIPTTSLVQPATLPNRAEARDAVPSLVTANAPVPAGLPGTASHRVASLLERLGSMPEDDTLDHLRILCPNLSTSELRRRLQEARGDAARLLASLPLTLELAAADSGVPAATAESLPESRPAMVSGSPANAGMLGRPTVQGVPLL